MLKSYVLSIPGSNTFVKRVFSILKNKWSDDNNKCLATLIKSEIQVLLNFDHSCQKFHDLINGDLTVLLENVKSEAKYYGY